MDEDDARNINIIVFYYTESPKNGFHCFREIFDWILGNKEIDESIPCNSRIYGQEDEAGEICFVKAVGEFAR